MRRRTFMLYLFLLLIASGCASQPGVKPFSFIVVDDIHFARRADYTGIGNIDERTIRTAEQSETTFRPLMDELKAQADTFQPRMAAVFSDGDILHGGECDHAGQLRRFFAAYDSVGMPVPLYNTTGNHEIADSMAGAYDEAFLPFMSRELGRQIDNRYFSLDIGNSHFILLDGQPPERKGGDHEERYFELMDKQWNWLEQDLEANRDKDHIFVISHPNIWPVNGGDVWYVFDPLKQQRFVDLLLRYNVRAFFGGHEHINSVVCYEDTSGRQLVQMVPNSEIRVEAGERRPAITDYAVENVTHDGAPWSDNLRNLVESSRGRIKYFRKNPGKEGYFVVSVDGWKVTVKFQEALGRGGSDTYVIEAGADGRTQFAGLQ